MVFQKRQRRAISDTYKLLYTHTQRTLGCCRLVSEDLSKLCARRRFDVRDEGLNKYGA